MADDRQHELVTNVLGVTREQLAKSMNLCAELEALLAMERRKTADLEQQLMAVQAKETKQP